MHEALLRDTEPAIAGRWRDEQVWVGGTSYGPHEAEYVAPVADEVPGLVADLVRFAVRTDVAPLVLAAVAHAQFETIHPFPDGNGRTGRALVHCLLRHHGSPGRSPCRCRRAAGRRGRLLRGADRLPPRRARAVVEAFTGGTLAAITNATQLVEQLRAVRAGWTEVVRAGRARRPGGWRTCSCASPWSTPGSSSANWASPRRTSPVRSPRWRPGVVTEFTGRRRNRMWQAREVLDALDAFAARAGRRR